MKTSLFDYQTETVSSIVKKLEIDKFHMLDADMGTGKTLMSLAILEKMEFQWAVVIAPKTLLANWQSEIRKNFQEPPNTLVWDSVKWSTGKYQRDVKEFSFLKGILLVNVEAFSHKNDHLERLIDMVLKERSITILDESSRIKDQSAARTKRIAKLFEKAPFKLAMTGTLNANSPLDVYGQFLFLSVQFWPSKGFRSWFLFRKYFAVLEDIYVQGGRVVKGGKIKEYRKLDQLASSIAPHVTTVRKEDVLSLPEKVFQRIEIDLSPEENKAYQDMKRKMMTTLSSGETIAIDKKIALYHKFRMICGGWIETDTPVVETPSKLAALKDFLEDSNEQFVIFATYSHEVFQIASSLTGALRYDGTVPIQERPAIIERFNSGLCQYLVVQPLTGAFGLNLQTSCNNTIYYSRPNSPEVWEQSQDRIHRIGQSKTCYYFDFVAKGKIDEKVIEALENHEDLSKTFSQISLRAIDRLVGG